MLQGLARRFVKVGRLKITYPGGRVGEYGDGTGPQIAIRITGRATMLKIALEPELMLASATWTAPWRWRRARSTTSWS